jgi:hypothetical protein
MGTEAPERLCRCGKPWLHYNSPEIQRVVEELVAKHGEFIPVRNGEGRCWLVPRHYIALHGIKEQELATLGFEEIT